MLSRSIRVLVACAAACGDGAGPPDAADLVFTYPIDGQVDVPLGTRVVVTFGGPVDASALEGCAVCLVGPDGPVAASAQVTGDGRTVEIAGAPLAAGTTYDLVVDPAVAPEAGNLPQGGPLLSFTTRTSRPRAAPPALVAVNGGAPDRAGEDFRPLLETGTIRLLFSEPLDARTVALAPDAIELVGPDGAPVPATLVSGGVHVSIDPRADLAAGQTYQLRLGPDLRDLGGQPLEPTAVTLVPRASASPEPVTQVLRTRAAGDPGPSTSRSGAEPNTIVIDKPVIGRETTRLVDSVVVAELGDPQALGGPVAFTLRRGQRLRASGLSIELGGEIPVGLETGDIEIELLTDGGGRLYRNRYQPADLRPDNQRAPLHVDLALDIAVYAVDPLGNAVLTQTVLGLQATGTAIATDGVLAIETVASMELAILGVTRAPSNLVLELVTDPDGGASAAPDTSPPALLASAPAEAGEQPVDAAIDLVFSEPIDLDRARAGGIRLEDAGGAAIAAVIESHGAAVLLRPLAPLPDGRRFRVALADVADAAGNRMAAGGLELATPALPATDAPATVTAIYPGAPCALTAAGDDSPGRCAGGADTDDLYRPFTLASGDPIEVAFSQPLRASSARLGESCGDGSVRVEELDGGGTCAGTMPGTLLVFERRLTFVPDRAWIAGGRYRLTLVSGGDDDCDPGELCGMAGAVSFDPLAGTDGGEGGGPPLVIDFTGAQAGAGTLMLAAASPTTDLNGSGYVEAGEIARDGNRAALRITGTTGDVGDAVFEGEDCLPGTPEVEACMYLTGAMPVELGEVATGCPLPDGSTAAVCLPVRLSAEAMYATSVEMTASVGVGITTDTGTSVMRIREPAGGPVTGAIIDRDGPTMVVALDLYMDAPDMSIPLSSHDLHSKPLTVSLAGPVSFLPDGRIVIELASTDSVAVEVSIDAPLGLAGSVQMAVPAGEMRLTLVSPPPRGGAP
ncbi:MAG TPA: Ig-like domain-containing protein [Kofleriaceae bacterium]|nr:Ig-like domain-containing protein [Kofleriaceae bacterium]